MKKILLSLLLAFGLHTGASASEGGYHWDQFPVDKMTDMAALQNGARLFVNYCLNCHSAAYVRYNRMRDIGLSEDQIKRNLLFATEKVGDTMKVSLDARQAKDWFGAQPPSTAGNYVSQLGTLVYFGFFLLMPWWSRLGTFKPVPERVTFKSH